MPHVGSIRTKSCSPYQGLTNETRRPPDISHLAAWSLFSSRIQTSPLYEYDARGLAHGELSRWDDSVSTTNAFNRDIALVRICNETHYNVDRLGRGGNVRWIGDCPDRLRCDG